MVNSLRVLIIPDKFKGTFDASMVAAGLRTGWHRQRPQDRLRVIPMSDGGDGFGAVMGRLLCARGQSTATVDADHRPVSARWWGRPDEAIAVIESAEIVGLARLGKADPRTRDTFGLGAVLVAASGAARTIIGVGGTATNDAGFGMARALGWRFVDGAGGEIDRWTDLERLEHIELPTSAPRLGDVTVAVDVRNPLLGPLGCSRVYGPQKGLVDPEAAEVCLGRLADVVGNDIGGLPGAGAGGGLGFGLAAFTGATLRPGFDVFAEAADLARLMDRTDLVITGEGCLDAQSLMGKGVGEIAAMARVRGIPCIAVVGRVDGDVGDGFAAVHVINQPHGHIESIEFAGEKVAVRWSE